MYLDFNLVQADTDTMAIDYGVITSQQFYQDWASAIWDQLYSQFTDSEGSTTSPQMIFAFAVSIMFLTKIGAAFALTKAKSKHFLARIFPREIYLTQSFKKDMQLTFINIFLQGSITFFFSRWTTKCIGSGVKKIFSTW